jgi:hypothetical protein
MMIKSLPLLALLAAVTPMTASAHGSCRPVLGGNVFVDAFGERCVVIERRIVEEHTVIVPQSFRHFGPRFEEETILVVPRHRFREGFVERRSGTPRFGFTTGGFSSSR